MFPGMRIRIRGIGGDGMGWAMYMYYFMNEIWFYVRTCIAWNEKRCIHGGEQKCCIHAGGFLGIYGIWHLCCEDPDPDSMVYFYFLRKRSSCPSRTHVAPSKDLNQSFLLIFHTLYLSIKHLFRDLKTCMCLPHRRGEKMPFPRYLTRACLKRQERKGKGRTFHLSIIENLTSTT